jgi:integrase
MTKPVKREDESRSSFSVEDLKTIFGGPWFKTGQGVLTKQDTYRTFVPYYYWLPLLGLFTGGGRINEMAQLYLRDIRKTEAGTWYVDINEDTVDKRLKTAPSKRMVPLHPQLIALGFDQWHAALTKAGHKRLFPELKHDKEKGYGKAATKWFCNYMASLGIPRDGRKTFHSFRHTYINALPEDIPGRLANQLIGHTRGKSTREKVYLKEAELDAAARYVSCLAITLPEIAEFHIAAGLKSIEDALQRKNRGKGGDEEHG